MEEVNKLYSQLIILMVVMCFQFERWNVLTEAAKSSSGVIVESLMRPVNCDVVAAEGDLLSVRFTQSGFGATPGAQNTMVTLGDTGMITGWNEALSGACQGESIKLIVPATIAYSELPPSLTSNVNITYTILVVQIVKPVPNNPSIDKSIGLIGNEVFMTTMVVMTTEETELSDTDGSKVKINKDTTRSGGGKSGADGNGKSLSFVQVIQFAVIPVAVILVVLVVYYLYKLRHPHKRTTFYKGILAAKIRCMEFVTQN